MTSSESNKLAVAMTDIKDIKEDIREIKQFMKEFDNKYVTRRELTIAKWFVTITLSIVAIGITIADKIRHS